MCSNAWLSVSEVGLAGTFLPLEQLTQLKLSYNTLSAVGDGVFAGLLQLSELDLRNNVLDTIGMSAFSGQTAGDVATELKSLQILHLSNNQLKFLQSG